MEDAMRIVLAAALICLVTPACSCSDLECGPGTHKEGNQCVPDVPGDTLEEDTVSEDVVLEDLGDVPDVEDGEDGEEVEVVGLERVDWTETRADPLTVTEAGTVNENLFGLPPTGFLLTDRDCQISFVDTSICRYSWKSDALAETAAVADATPVRVDRFTTHDASLLGLLTGASVGCYDDFGYPIYTGAIEVIDAATGHSRWHVPVVYTSMWTGSFFTNMDNWAELYYGTENVCVYPEPFPSSDTHILKVSDGTEAAFDEYGVEELFDGRWLTTTMVGEEPRMAIVDPASPGSPVILHDAATWNPLTMQVGRRWIHAEFKAEATSESWTWLLYDLESGQVFLWPVPENMWQRLFSHTWILVCEQAPATPIMACTAHDMTGEFPDREIQVVDDNYVYALAGASAGLYYIGVTADAEPRPVLRHLNLQTGEEAQVMDQSARMVVTRDETAALARTGDDSLYLLQGREATLVVENLSAWRTPRQQSRPYPDVYHGEDIVPIVTASSILAYSLSLLDLASSTLYLVSNRVYFDDSYWDRWDYCDSPNFAFTMGIWGTHTHFYFYERDDTTGELSLYLVPTDFSSPPALMAVVPADTCRPPRVSAAGDRAALIVEDSGTGTRTLLGAPLP
jgi:hypothetical protein